MDDMTLQRVDDMTLQRMSVESGTKRSNIDFKVNVAISISTYFNQHNDLL